jgi:hypothetical protein
MIMKRLAVIGGFISQEVAIVCEPGVASAAKEPPIVMADLVAEVTRERTVGLVHAGAALLALRGVCLRGVDRNHAVFMSCGRPFSIGLAFRVEEVER